MRSRLHRHGPFQLVTLMKPLPKEYVRTGNDVVLTAVATGLITAVIAGLFN